MENNLRKKEYQKDKYVESILKELSYLISDKKPENLPQSYPILFIIGCARSGTTLIAQYLAQFETFCYPTNFISRFYFAPYVGCLLQKLMFNLDRKNELFGFISKKVGFDSNLGKTRGPLAPNEFWYYWRRFFKFDDIQLLSSNQLLNIDTKEFIDGLLSIQFVFDKPLFLKGMIANWHIPFLSRIFKNSYFLVIKRDLIFNAQSLFLARRKFFGDINKWYSFKPKEYNTLKELDPHEQVVAQVYYTNKAVDLGISEVPAERIIDVSYETFCDDPAIILEMIKSKLNIEVINPLKNQPLKFYNNNKLQIREADWNVLVKYAKKYR